MISTRVPQRRLPPVEPWQRSLYTIVLAELIAFTSFSISQPFIPFYIQELGVTDLKEVAVWVGLINAAAPMALAIASPIWGALSDRHGRKLMLVRAMLGGGLVTLLVAFARTPYHVAMLRVFEGLLSGTVIAATILVVSTVPKDKAAYALGLLQTVIFAGSSLGPFVGGILSGYVGYRATFAVAGSLLLLTGTASAFLIKESFTPPPRPVQTGNRSRLAGYRALAADPLLLAMVSLLVLNNTAMAVTAPVLPLFVQTLTASVKEAATATGIIVGVTALTNALGALWAGRAAGRLGTPRLIIGCLAVSGLVHLPQILAGSAVHLLFLRAIMGFTMGAVNPVANAVLAQQSPEGRHGLIFGVSGSLNAVGRAVGPMLGTLVVTSLGIAQVFPVTGVLLLLGMALAAQRLRRLDQSPAGAASRPL